MQTNSHLDRWSTRQRQNDAGSEFYLNHADADLCSIRSMKETATLRLIFQLATAGLTLVNHLVYTGELGKAERALRLIKKTLR